MNKPRSDDTERLRSAVSVALEGDRHHTVTIDVNAVPVAVATVRDTDTGPQARHHRSTRTHRRYVLVTTHPELSATEDSEWLSDPARVRLITPRERLERILRFHFTAQISTYDDHGALIMAPDIEDDPRMIDEYALTHFVLTTPPPLSTAAERTYGSVPPPEAYARIIAADPYNDWSLSRDGAAVHVVYHGSQEPDSPAARRWAPSELVPR